MHVLKLAAALVTVSLSTLVQAEDVASTMTPTQPVTSLDFKLEQGTSETLSLDGQTIHYRAYLRLPYVKNPVQANYQVLNVFIPEAYYQNKPIGVYTANTAPILLQNEVGGYMPAEPNQPGRGREGGVNTLFAALAKGYVVVSPGVRGRNLDNQAPNTDTTKQTIPLRYLGKAPAAIVDLKAVVRYLHYNDAVMLGNAERIISNGTSAGGALSALLGASGNASEYQPYLSALGAAEARDDVFAVSAYCPITNLEHADSAYEWQMQGITDYKKLVFSHSTDYKLERKLIEGKLSAAEIKLSEQFKASFPTYVNSLKLSDVQGKSLELDSAGNGSFKEHVKTLVIQSAQHALEQGVDLKAYPWITVKDGRIQDLDFARYLQYVGRMKTPPAFDALDLSSGENELFGTETLNAQHFTPFAQEHSTVKGNLADPQVIKLMNPMHYIGAPATQTAKYWRIRHGTIDKDTSLAIPSLLALKLQQHKTQVDFALVWDQAHGGDYDLEQLFAWMEQASQSQ